MINTDLLCSVGDIFLYNVELTEIGFQVGNMTYFECIGKNLALFFSMKVVHVHVYQNELF